MEFFIVRQPVFDNKLDVHSYELIYNKKMKNGLTSTTDSAGLISNIFNNMELASLVGKKEALITFSGDMLSMKIPLLFPSSRILINVADFNDVDEQTLEAIKSLKENNYKFVLDCFSFSEKEIENLTLFDIVKIKFNLFEIGMQRNFILKNKNKVSFLADGIESRDEFLAAKKLGYRYLQGTFFCKPVKIKGKEIESIQSNYLSMLSEINKTNPSFDKLEEIAKRDLGISYKMLKTANSIYYGSRHKIESIKQAMIRIGINEIKRWVYLMIMRNPTNVENNELVKNCLVRGKFMELLSGYCIFEVDQSDCFIAGILSSIDVILNKEMEIVLKELLLPEKVNEALLGTENNVRKLLDYVIMYEEGMFSLLNDADIFKNENQKFISQKYVEALKWADNLE